MLKGGGSQNKEEVGFEFKPNLNGVVHDHNHTDLTIKINNTGHPYSMLPITIGNTEHTYSMLPITIDYTNQTYSMLSITINKTDHTYSMPPQTEGNVFYYKNKFSLWLLLSLIL